MIYDDFVSTLIKNDSRNVFKKVRDNNKVSQAMPALYSLYDPVDVEFKYNHGITRMTSLSEMNELQSIYNYVDADCIFADCNGDPIYMKNGQVYTTLHGSDGSKAEKLASSFEEFIKQVIKQNQ